MGNIPKKVIEFAKSKGLGAPKFINSGSWGNAYEVGDKVLKITGDFKEYNFVQKRLIGKSIFGLVDYYEVGLFNHVPGDVQYWIIMEKADELSEGEKSAVGYIYLHLLDFFNLKRQHKKYLTEYMYKADDVVKANIKNQMGILYSMEAPSLTKQLKNHRDDFYEIINQHPDDIDDYELDILKRTINSKKERREKIVSAKPHLEDMFNQMFKVVKSLGDDKIYHQDIHAGNWGKRNGRLVLFDIRGNIPREDKY